MFKSLFIIQLRAVFFTMFAAKKTAKPKTTINIGKKILIAIFAVYVIACMFFFFGLITAQLCTPLIEAGLDTAYFVLIGLMAFMLMFLGSVFLTEKQLYEANDNELLLSMPIPPAYVVLTRIASVFLINVMYGSFTLVPAAAVYFMQKGFDPLVLLFMIPSGLLLSVLSLSVSAAGGWLLALLGSSLKRKKLFSTVFMLTFFFTVMGFYFNLQKILAKLVAEGAALSDALRKVFPPLFFFGKSVAESDFLSFLLLAAASLVPAALITGMIARSFINIATKNKGSAGKYIYKERRLSAASPKNALLVKEAKRFFTSVIYLMNAGLGSIFMIIFAIAVAFKGPSIIVSLMQSVTNNAAVALPFPLESLLPAIIGAAVSFCTSANNTACCSLSLEGKNFPLLKSMPLSYYDIIIPKIAFNFLWGFIPITLVSAASFFRLGLTLADFFLILLGGLVFQLFTAVWGMLCNIFFPKFDWINEVTVIKQSAASLFGMLGAMGFFSLFIGGFAFAATKLSGGDLDPALILQAALPSAIAFFAVMSALCLALLVTVGKKKFHAISA